MFPWIAALAVVAAVGWLLSQKQQEPVAGAGGAPPAPGGAPPPPPAPAPAPKKGRTLNDALLASTLELLPTSSTVLRPGDAVLDGVYGQRKPDAFGAPVWGYYQTILGKNDDGTPRKGGTTCGIVLAYEMAKAGWPVEMINRLPTDPVAPGSGFTPGLHISKIVGYAQKKGWYKRTPGTDLQPGDAYHIDHPEKPNSDHVGVIVGVNGNQIETADGGQETGATVKRNVRTLSADGKTLTLDGRSARVLGVIRATPEAVA